MLLPLLLLVWYFVVDDVNIADVVASVATVVMVDADAPVVVVFVLTLTYFLLR